MKVFTLDIDTFIATTENIIQKKKLIKDAGVFEIIYPETNFLKLTKVPFIISIERVKL